MSDEFAQLLVQIDAAEAALGRDLAGARREFEAVLDVLWSPERRMAEGRALFGLAQSLLGLGDTAGAVERASAALQAFRAARKAIEASPDRVRLALAWQEARGAEAECAVLVADLQLRTGANAEARKSLDDARRIFAALGRQTAPAARAGLGRIALRHGRYREAESLFQEALEAYEASGHRAGQVGARLQLAELQRQEGRLEEAEQSLHAARPLAHDADSPLLVARVLAALGGVMLQVPRPSVAASVYEEALPRVREARDREMEGFVLLGLGLARTRSDASDALDPLLQGTRILAELGHAHGVGGGLHRLAEHALRRERPASALLLSTASWELWATTDPRRGVGQALRMVVKSLAALGKSEAAVAVALAREAVAGTLQPNAVEVATYYRDRSSPEVLGELTGLDEPGLLQRAMGDTRAALRPHLSEDAAHAGILQSLSSIPGALQALQLATEGMLLDDCAPTAREASHGPVDDKEIS